MRFLIVIALAGMAGVAHGQATDTLRLGVLLERAAQANPRARQEELLGRQSALRQQSLARELLPALSLESQAQYQSDVPRVPIAAPGGPPPPPHDTYDARASATQRLLDPLVPARRALERAQLLQSRAMLQTSLFATRQQVNDAFFATLLAQAHGDELRASISVIESQLATAAARVREGAALPSEEHTLRAELLRRRQALAASEIQRRASLMILGDLTGAPVDSATLLAPPGLATVVLSIHDAAARLDLRARPEYAQFAATREVLARQESALRAQDKPRVAAFGRAGYGRPGLNPLNDHFDSYWLAGVQLQWAPWSWGAGRRDREVLAVQRDIVATEESAFTDQLRRAVTQDLAAIERLESAVAMDAEIIVLRERIAGEARLRFAEAVITSAEFAERETELLAARLTGATHRVELEQARARLLTTLGLQVQ